MRVALGVSLAGLLFAALGYGQTGQGVLTGIVTDPSGAAIPGVAVRVTDTSTQFSYAATTNSEGLYRAPYLNPGFYDVAFEMQGFKKVLRTKVQVRSTETARLDLRMEVGNVSEQVEVSAAVALLEVETSVTGHLVTGTELTKLPTPQMKVDGREHLRWRTTVSRGRRRGRGYWARGGTCQPRSMRWKRLKC
jgi:hypothetical protein